MGSSIVHVHVVVAPFCTGGDGVPLATATVPAGTVMWNANVALSDGWSLDGNQRWAASGSLIVYEPPTFGSTPPAARRSGCDPGPACRGSGRRP